MTYKCVLTTGCALDVSRWCWITREIDNQTKQWHRYAFALHNRGNDYIDLQYNVIILSVYGTKNEFYSFLNVIENAIQEWCTEIYLLNGLVIIKEFYWHEISRFINKLKSIITSIFYSHYYCIKLLLSFKKR